MPHPRSCRRTLSIHPATCTNGSLRHKSGALSVSHSSTVYETRLSNLASKYCMCILWELRTLAQILFAVQQRGMTWENT